MPSNFKNLVSKFFFGQPSANPIPTSIAATTAPKTAEDHINELDQILKKNQDKLEKFLHDLKFRFLERNISNISFVKPPEKLKYKASKPVSIPAPKDTFDFKQNLPTGKKKNVPINPIFEVTHLEWRKRANGLKDILDGVVIDIQNFLLNLARSVNYNPPNTDLKNLTSDLHQNKFPGLDRRTVLEILKRLRTFRIAYNQLTQWLIFFQRIEKTQSKAAKKKI